MRPHEHGAAGGHLLPDGPLLIRLSLAASVAVLFACAHAPPSAGMPQRLLWSFESNAGNCATIYEVDAAGTVTSSSGCESSAHENPPRALTPAAKDRFVAALDRLRGSRLWSADASSARCDDGVRVQIQERGGEQRAWSFCRDVSQPGGDANVPREVRAVFEAFAAP